MPSRPHPASLSLPPSLSLPLPPDALRSRDLSCASSHTGPGVAWGLAGGMLNEDSSESQR